MLRQAPAGARLSILVTGNVGMVVATQRFDFKFDNFQQVCDGRGDSELGSVASAACSAAAVKS
jgi:hypothetical protein